MTAQMKDITDKQNVLLDDVLTLQAAVRTAVNERDWNALVTHIAALERATEAFTASEVEREAAFKSNSECDAETRAQFRALKAKLVRSQAENKALGDYISIMQGFVKGIVSDALPQSRNKVYGPNGAIVQSKPSSVVINTLY